MVYTLPIKIKINFYVSLRKQLGGEKHGKNIYHFAIYKCPSDHSWDKVINIFKTTTGLVNEDRERDIKESKLDIIELKDITNRGYSKILIIVNEVSKKLRIDKLLSHQINDMSRSELRISWSCVRITSDRGSFVSSITSEEQEISSKDFIIS